MQPMWSVFLVVIAFFVILRLRGRKRRKPPKEVYARRIAGSQVTALLEPEISRACLMDHGAQFGKGFRRKEGPLLPHDEHCKCRAMPFAFTSNEVFNGALRDNIPLESSIPGFPPDQARRLIERLREIGADPLPGKDEAYIAAVGMEHFADPFRSDVEAFLRQRYRYLQSRAQIPAAPRDDSGDPEHAQKESEGHTPAEPS